MSYFTYSEGQWERIVEAAGNGALNLSRSLLELRSLQWHGNDRAIKSKDDKDLRKKEIETLTAALAIVSRSPIAEELERIIARAKWFNEQITSINPRRKHSGSLEGLISDVLDHWEEIGNGEPRFSVAPGKQAFGPTVRFVQAVVEPTFGPLKGNTVRAVILKMRHDKAAKNSGS